MHNPCSVKTELGARASGILSFASHRPFHIFLKLETNWKERQSEAGIPMTESDGKTVEEIRRS